MRAPVDLRLVPAAVAAWAGAFLGVLLVPRWAAAAAAVLLIGSARVGWALHRRRPVRLSRGVRPGGRVRARHRDRDGPTPQATALLALVAGSLVLASVAAQVHQRTAGPLGELVTEGAVVTVTGRVGGDPAPVDTPPERGGGRRVRVPLGVSTVEGRGLTLRARAPLLVLGPAAWDGVELGQHVRTSGRLVATAPGEDVAALVIAHREPQVLDDGPAHHRLANRMRAGLVDAVAEAPSQAQGLVPGIAVGDDSRLPPDLQDAMRTVSLTHITAVSGAHVAIVLGAVLAVLSWAPRWVRALVGGVVLVCFVVLVRPEASVLRSATMGGVGLLALLLGRPSRALPALCSAVVVLLVLDPWMARSYGFVLSVLATTGLVLLSGPWAAHLGRWLPRTLAHVVAVPAAAQVCCAPVVVLLEPALATYAVPANVLAVPAVPAATVLGVVATVVGPWLPALAAPLVTAAGWYTGWIAWVAVACAGLPGARLPWLGGIGGALLLAGVTVVALVVTRRGRRARLAAGVAAGVVLLLALVPGPRRAVAVLLAGVPRDWVAVQCDVGQGSAFVLRGPDDVAVMVDVGPPGAAAAGCLRQLDVRDLDLLVLSHVHADHVGGLPEVLEEVDVRRVLLSPHGTREPAEQRVLATLARAAVPVERPAAGAVGAAGEVRWRVLWPSARAVQLADPADRSAVNDLSLTVLLETSQLSVLAPGDLEPAGQRGLLRELRALGPPRSDVVLVPHHGSPAQLPELAEAVGARLALVSVGEGNDYGHPAPATLELYGRRGALVLRTDECGPVVLVLEDHGPAALC